MGNPINKKICIVVKSLGGGGAERSAGLLSILLSNLGHEIHVVTVLNDIKYSYAGSLLNLGEIKEQNSKFLGNLKRFLVLRKYIKNNNFDYVIDNRTRVNRIKEFIIAKVLYKPSKTIYCIRSYNLYNYMPTRAFIARIWYGNAYRIVGVSESITKKIENNFHFINAVTIPNPIDNYIINTSHEKSIESDYILFFGRLIDEVKNVTLLLKAYQESKLYKSGVKLIIMGNGKDKTVFESMVSSMPCAIYIEFLDFNPNPIDIITNAKFTVLTSHYEGFPRMILESLSLGTPVISVDCESGPSEIIQNEENGLLVENYNYKALAEAMNKLFFNKELYKKCKENAKESVLKFSQDNIAMQWQKILN